MSDLCDSTGAGKLKFVLNYKIKSYNHLQLIVCLICATAQELEKFKFVLDYKIKELKKQIEPREAEIIEMKDQIKEVRVCTCVRVHVWECVLCVSASVCRVHACVHALPIVYNGSR